MSCFSVITALRKCATNFVGTSPCNKLQRTATNRGSLQQIAADCNRMQQNTTDCNRLQQILERAYRTSNCAPYFESRSHSSMIRSIYSTDICAINTRTQTQTQTHRTCSQRSCMQYKHMRTQIIHEISEKFAFVLKWNCICIECIIQLHLY